jgi:hypothetical protein
LISVSLAPLSYFFCANAARDPESNANADAPPTNPRLLVIKERLPFLKMAREFLLESGKKEGRRGATFRTTVMLQPPLDR